MEIINKKEQCDFNIKNNDILKELYYFLKSKTSEVKRENWENVLVHFEQTADIYIKISEKPYFEWVLASLLHDAIEDWYLTFDGIKEKYGIIIAVIVKSISKKKEFNYLNEEEKEIVLKSRILNEKWKISNETRKKNKKWVLNKVEKDSFNLMNIAKERRNKDYFWNIESIEAMSEHILSIAEKNWLVLTKIELNKLSRIALEIKYSDRIHNLRTQWDPNNVWKVRRKVRETIKYLLEQSKEVNYYAYLQMEELTFGLDSQLDEFNKEVKSVLD